MGSRSVWYLYFSGREPELVRSLDKLMDGAHALTDQVNDEAYRRFLSSDDEGAALEDAAHRTRTELDKILDLVASAGAGAAEYGDALDSASSALAGVDESDQLSSVVANIVTATRIMRERNETLESRLGESAAEIEQLKVNLADTRRKAMTDALTGILNRSSFDAEIARAVQEAQESRQHLSLLMADIDHFKRFNDSFGHQVGDKVLALTAATLKECIKGQDIAARYGGEEFVVVLPRTDLRGAAKVGETVRQRISEKQLVNRSTGENLGRITISVGASNLLHGEDLTEFVERADQALYLAKRTGRNRVATQDDVRADAISAHS